jgi:hypothetical protein
MPSLLLTIDVAHPPRPADDVEEQLLEAWNRVRASSTVRIVKVIHGHGSSGKGGSTRTVVRNWAFHHRSRFRAIIDGEVYGLFNPEVQDLRSEVGTFDDPDLDRANPGITYIWVQ